MEAGRGEASLTRGLGTGRDTGRTTRGGGTGLGGGGLSTTVGFGWRRRNSSTNWSRLRCRSGRIIAGGRVLGRTRTLRPALVLRMAGQVAQNPDGDGN